MGNAHWICPNFFMDKALSTDFTIKACQCRLNHRPFEINVNIVSSNAVLSIIRIFLGPKFYESGRTIELNENHSNFVFLDQFEHDLVVGPNRIVNFIFVNFFFSFFVNNTGNFFLNLCRNEKISECSNVEKIANRHKCRVFFISWQN